MIVQHAGEAAKIYYFIDHKFFSRATSGTTYTIFEILHQKNLSSKEFPKLTVVLPGLLKCDFSATGQCCKE